MLPVKYTGCIGVKESMRSLSQQERSEVAKESIKRLCEAHGINRKIDKKRADNICRMLDDEPDLRHSGTSVHLRVTSTHLNIISRDSQQILIQHEMPNVSFASRGDEDTINFVAYVAKDAELGRACFVLECGYDTATNVLESIRLGFELRTQQILKNSATPVAASRLTCFSNTMNFNDLRDTSLDAAGKTNNENQCDETMIAATRASLKMEPWYHGAYLCREESETRLKHDGDFLVRESMLDPGHFVLSVMHDGEKLHLLFDSMCQVRTKEMDFDDINHLVKYHHTENLPIVSGNRVVYLRNGVRPTARNSLHQQ